MKVSIYHGNSKGIKHVSWPLNIFTWWIISSLRKSDGVALAAEVHRGLSLVAQRVKLVPPSGRCVALEWNRTMSTLMLGPTTCFCCTYLPKRRKIFRHQFLAGFSTQQPRWQNGEVEGFVSLNKIGLNFSTSTHICNYLISNMKHTLQNLCFGQRAFWVGWWELLRKDLKRYLGLREAPPKAPRSARAL